MTLFFDVLLDDFVSDVATTNAKVSACPQMAAPEFLSQVRELTHQLVGGLTFEHLNESADRDFGRHAHEQMNVVACHMPFHDRYLMDAADFADQFTKALFRLHLSSRVCDTS